MSVVWLSSEYNSVQLSSYVFIYSFILIRSLAYYAKLKKNTRKHRNKNYPHHPRWHVTHVSTPPTLARHPRKHTTHATHASMPLTPPILARIARHFSNWNLIYQTGSFNKWQWEFIRQENHKPETQIITEVKKSNNRSCSFIKSLKRSNNTKKNP